MKWKKLFIRFSILFWIVFFLLLCIKLPTTQAYKGTNFENIKQIKMTNDIFYDQKVQIKVDNAKQIVLKLDKIGNPKGKLNFEILDNNGDLINKGQYNVDELVEKNTLQLFFVKEVNKGDNYHLKIWCSGVEGGTLKLQTTSNYPSKYLKDNKKMNRSIVYYVKGELPDKTYFWFPAFGIIVSILLSIVNKEGKYEEKNN